jgi:hypothetical protein
MERVKALNMADITPEMVQEVTDQLMSFSLPEMHAIREQLGVDEKGLKSATKGKLAGAIIERSRNAGTAEPKPTEPKPKKEPKGKAKPMTPEQQEETVHAAMRELDSQVDTGAPVLASDLRKKMPKNLQSQEAFSNLMIGLAEQGKVVLHRHDHLGKLTPKEKSELIVDPSDGTHYALVAYRMDEPPIEPATEQQGQDDAGTPATGEQPAGEQPKKPASGGKGAREAPDPAQIEQAGNLLDNLQKLWPGKSVDEIIALASDPEKFKSEIAALVKGQAGRQAGGTGGTGNQPVSPKESAAPKQPKPKKEPGVLSDNAKPVYDKVRALEERAAEVDSTHDDLVSSLKELNLDSLGVGDLKTMATELGRKVSGATSKKEIIKTIWRVVLERKDSLETAAV